MAPLNSPVAGEEVIRTEQLTKVYPGDIRAAARVGSNTDEQYWSDGLRVARAME